MELSEVLFCRVSQNDSVARVQHVSLWFIIVYVDYPHPVREIGVAAADEYDVTVFVADDQSLAIESSSAIMIAEGADGEEAGGFHFGEEVLGACRCGEGWDVEVSGVC